MRSPVGTPAAEVFLQPGPAWAQPCVTSLPQLENLPDLGNPVESISPGKSYVYRMKWFTFVTGIKLWGI